METSAAILLIPESHRLKSQTFSIEGCAVEYLAM